MNKEAILKEIIFKLVNGNRLDNSEEEEIDNIVKNIRYGAQEFQEEQS